MFVFYFYTTNRFTLLVYKTLYEAYYKRELQLIILKKKKFLLAISEENFYQMSHRNIIRIQTIKSIYVRN